MQYRSTLQYTLAGGTMLGYRHQYLAERLGKCAEAELTDARHLIEKITALGGEPTTEVEPIRYIEDPEAAVDWLIEAESEVLQALQDSIEPTGREARSEALEHRLEHVIMRKQEQVDYLLRARGGG